MHLLFFGVFVPYGAIRSKKRIRENKLPPKKQYFIGVITQHLLFIAVSLMVSKVERVEAFPAWSPGPRDILIGIAALALLIAFMAPRWHRNVIRRERPISRWRDQ